MPIKLYNTEAKELIGVFRNNMLAARYLYKPFDYKKTSRVQSCLSKGYKAHDSIFNFPVAVRTAAEKELPEDKDWEIHNNYPQPTAHQMHGFNGMAAMDSAIKNKRQK